MLYEVITDDTAVTGYQVAVDGSPVGTTASTSYTVTGLNPGTSHTVAVSYNFV